MSDIADVESQMTGKYAVDAPTVSVVIATYNMAQYVSEAVQSVLQQTFTDLEVHVIDDGSSDGTEAVIAPLLSDKRMFYHRQNNFGQTKAKNNGLKHCRGDFVGFCDADDVWLPHKIERQLQVLRADDDIGAVYTRNRMMLQSGQPVQEKDDVGLYFSGWITEELFKRNFISFGTVLARRRCLEEFGGFNESYRMGIDWDLWLRMSTRYKIEFLDEVTYLYRVWPGQMSNNWRGRYDHAFRIMEDFLREHGAAVSRAVVKEAYADSFTQRGRLRATFSGEYLAGLGDMLHALRWKPDFMPAWKSILRIALLALGGRNAKAGLRISP